MRICLSAGAYPTKEKPFASFIAAIAKEFTHHGHEVVVIAPQSLTKLLFREKEKPLPYYSEYPVDKTFVKVYRPLTITFSDKGYLGRLTLKMNQWTVCRCFNKLKIKFDIIYAHFWTSCYNIIKCADAQNLPMFVASGEDNIEFVDLICEKDILKIKNAVNGCICVSTKNKNQSVRLNLIDESKCIVLPNAVDSKLFYNLDKNEVRKQLGFSTEDYIISFVGRFNYRKGAKRVSDAISLLNDNSIKSIFIGSTLADEGDENNPNCEGIVFKGRLDHSDICLYLNAADIFVLPSVAEGCSNSIVEAMACGLPIISSNLEFNYDILDSTNSILINPLNVNEIASSITSLKQNPILRKEMSESSLSKSKSLDYSLRISRILEFIEIHK